MIRKIKKSQEEMVGFVLIIIIVAVIMLILLAISIRKPAKMQESAKIKNFLNSMLKVSSDCQIAEEKYESVGELISFCKNNKICLNKEYSCQILNKTASKLVESAFLLGEGSEYRGYKFSIQADNSTLISIVKGNSSTSIDGSDCLLSSADEQIHIVLQIYS